ncbi:MAG TPA: acyl-CoA dehydrogenase family protein [Polyangiaceae bacterium]|nr:acyl-CoA dehydrogenase family protein [Polyangiaceae bacterium]
MTSSPAAAQSSREKAERNLRVAEDLARDFASTAVERDRRGGTAKRERDLLRQSGLLALSVPEEYGGLGAGWSQALELVRVIARADSSLGHLFGFQHLMLATTRLFGNREQWAELFRRSASERWFWGNALNPLDPRTTLSRDGTGYRLEGSKSFCSGASDSDMLIVSALHETEPHRLVVAALPTARDGIRVHSDWDNMGQRQTDSGSVDFQRVRVEPHEVLTTPGPLGSTFASLRPCIAQAILANVYLGIAEGAFAEAQRYTKTQRRVWPGSGVTSPARDPYVLRHYGELWLALETAREVTDRAGILLEKSYELGDALTREQRGRTAIAIAAAKVATTRTGLDVTSRLFEVGGARATAANLGLDRYWRNLRTHTLHDPVDYKIRELGIFALSGELPEPSFYS